jgi:DNA-binding NarL/FixJ family response regulator
VSQLLKILLVDDEQRVLDGLKRMLRARRDWQVVAANGGEEALRMLAQEPVDVVVSDMRMPGMGGDELLDRVRRQHPAAIRIILSGQSEHEHLVSALGPVHQFLSKPCSLDQLADAIERGVGLRQRLTEAGDGAAAGADEGTPPEPPERFRALLALSRTGDLVPERMAELLGTDAALAGRLVAAAAVFSGPSRPAPAALVDAVAAISPAGTLALTLLGSLLAPDGRHDALWRHALEVGALAKAIAMAEQSSADHIAWAVQAGVLHDLGLVAGGAGGGHALLGARTLSRWGLPGPIVEAVAFHHDPLAARLPGTAPLTAVHVADAWCAERAPDPDHPAPGPDAGYLERHGLAERLAHWAALAAQRAVRVEP